MDLRNDHLLSVLNAANENEFCTLPTPARPLRLAEFEALFRNQTAGPRWLDSHRVEFTFDDADDHYHRMSDLVARETECCPFFDFSITEHPQHAGEKRVIVLRVGVPASRHDVLAALTNRAVDAWIGSGP